MSTRREETARRAAVCVKACEGIPTRLLEDRFITRLITECLHVEDDRIRALLNELSDAKPDRRGVVTLPTRAAAS